MSTGLKTVLRLLLAATLGAYLISWWRLDALPRSGALVAGLEADPAQSAVEAEPVVIEAEGYRATLKPLFDYEIRGLNVAQYDSDNFFDYAHKNDPFNTNDLCLIWGENLRDEVYDRVEFTHGEFTCFFKTDDWDVFRRFRQDQLSNTHVIPADAKVFATVKRMRIGDQVELRGRLVNMEIAGPDGPLGSRNTSVSRDDTGNGACEVMYVTSARILKPGQPGLRLTNKLSWFAFLVFLAVYFVQFLIGLFRGYRPVASALPDELEQTEDKGRRNDDLPPPSYPSPPMSHRM